jgi:hypothetical protein
MVKKPSQKHEIVDRPAKLDPLDVNGRLYQMMSDLLDDMASMKKVGIRDRIAALVAIGRIQTMFMGLRKEFKVEQPAAGSTVRKFASAFSAHAARGRKASARSARAAEPEPVEHIFDDEAEGELPN